MSKTALVLLNMGGPNNLDEVEVFLTNMFNDKNIITVKSNLLRSFIAFLITTSRKNVAKENYKKIGGKSPIVTLTKKLIDKLQNELKNKYVTFAMRYTPPFAKEIVSELKEKGIDKVILFPMYPQYSTTTAKSSLEDFQEEVEKQDLHVEIRQLDRFYENTLYNELIIDNIEKSLSSYNSKDFDLIFSAHSLPKKIIDAGDTYEKEIHLHVELLKKILVQRNLDFKNIHIAYQSKLGPVKWLKPSLNDKLKIMENKNAIICPISFTIDNSETDFELSIEYKEIANKLGFKNYIVSKCPNDSDKFVKAILEIIS